MITINGEKKEIAYDSDLLSWLGSNGIDPAKIAVEYNGEILSRADFGKIILKDGDSLEIVVFVGGG